MSPDPALKFELIQKLNTSCARAVLPFRLDGELILAIPQMAEDQPGEPAYMNGGNSNIPMLLLRWTDGGFHPWKQLAVPGGEDAEFFHIGSRAFLATCGVRSGSGPYDLNTNATLYEWNGIAFKPFQNFPAFAAKQWRAFTIGDRHFLALAQGVKVPGATARNPEDSIIFEWDGGTFVPLQTVPSGWGYNWSHFEIDGADYLAYADHHSPSIIMRWNGNLFDTVQTLEGQSGRAFHFFRDAGECYLAFAVLLGDSVLYRWQAGSFVLQQKLSGPGGREFTSFFHDGALHLVLVNFLTGSPKEPKTDLDSLLFRLTDGRLERVHSFSTLGATDAAAFSVAGQTFVAVAESLTADVRFHAQSSIYRVS